MHLIFLCGLYISESVLIPSTKTAVLIMDKCCNVSVVFFLWCLKFHFETCFWQMKKKWRSLYLGFRRECSYMGAWQKHSCYRRCNLGTWFFGCKQHDGHNVESTVWVISTSMDYQEKLLIFRLSDLSPSMLFSSHGRPGRRNPRLLRWSSWNGRPHIDPVHQQASWMSVGLCFPLWNGQDVDLHACSWG